ncbi:MAG: hypothetical protein ACXWBQ_04760 [Usitatibacter sp.]
MSRIFRFVQALLVLAAFSGQAHATFHLWRMTQFYSNADGSVQYIELMALASGQQYLSNHTITSSSGSNTHSYTFTTDLPGDSAMDMEGGYYGMGMGMSFKSMLIGTQGFAALNVVRPDYIVPNGFLFATNGRIDYAGSDSFAYASLPTDGTLALNRDGSMVMNTPMNFDGSSGSIVGAAAPFNVQGLWWRSPANSESGWGINITHQGDILFATWFTYDADGSGMWIVMPNGAKAAANKYSGDLFRTTGPAFSATPFDPKAVVATQVGTGTFTFTDGDSGTFDYTLNGVTQSKTIMRETLFSGPGPTCVEGGTQGAAPNFQDLWWKSPANSESGWGINITHQGDTLFATWFTYDTSGKGLWLVMPNGPKTATNVYSGDLFRTTGPSFASVPFDATKVVATKVGTATFTFTDANNGTFAYTVNGTAQSKPIMREAFSSPTTVCK